MAHRPIALAAVAAAIFAVSASAETPGKPLATVRGHSVIHQPWKVTVRVPKAARYVGSDRFDLYGVADAEIEVFAKADAQKNLKKLYWIQFESYWPSKPDLTHDYSDNRRATYWGRTVWLRSGPVSATAPARAGSDREHVQALLTRAGYKVPPEVMNVRMVQLLDDPQNIGKGRDELMLIYSENLAPTGKRLTELVTDGKPNASWAPIEKGLIERATRAFRVERK